MGESETRPVLGPAGNNNKARSVVELRKPVTKLKNNKVEKLPHEIKSPTLPLTVPSVMRKQQEHHVFKSNLSMNASCSSDASSDSSHSTRASTGRSRSRSRSSRHSIPVLRRKQQSTAKAENVEVNDEVSASPDSSFAKKRCAWVTPNTGILHFALAVFFYLQY